MTARLGILLTCILVLANNPAQAFGLSKSWEKQIPAELSAVRSQETAVSGRQNTIPVPPLIVFQSETLTRGDTLLMLRLNLKTPGVYRKNVLEYTGQEKEPDLGLYYYGARFYDPDTGRFWSRDVKREFWNSYSYVGNNPIIAVDPSGNEHGMITSSYHRDVSIARSFANPDGPAVSDEEYVAIVKAGLKSPLNWAKELLNGIHVFGNRPKYSSSEMAAWGALRAFALDYSIGVRGSITVEGDDFGLTLGASAVLRSLNGEPITMQNVASYLVEHLPDHMKNEFVASKLGKMATNSAFGQVMGVGMKGSIPAALLSFDGTITLLVYKLEEKGIELQFDHDNQIMYFSSDVEINQTQLIEAISSVLPDESD